MFGLFNVVAKYFLLLSFAIAKAAEKTVAIEKHIFIFIPYF